MPYGDDADRFAVGATLRTEAGSDLVVRSVAPYRDRGLIVGFAGVGDRTAAEALRGSTVTVDESERRSLGDGEFWPEQLVGLEVMSPDGRSLGRVTAVDLGTAQDRLVVATEGGCEVLVPFVDDIVGDPEDGRIVVDAPEGLF